MNAKKIVRFSTIFTVLITLLSLFFSPVQNKAVNAAATERPDVALTEFTISHEDGTSGNAFNYWERTKLKLSWDASVYENELKEGDYFNVNLPNQLKFPLDSAAVNFDVVDPDNGSVVAKSTITPGNDGGGTLKVVFTKYVESRYNIKGTVTLASEFVYEKIKKGDVNRFDIDINGKVKTTEVNIGTINIDPDEVFAKWARRVSSPAEVGWTLRMNYTKGGSYTNLKITDQLQAKNGSLNGIHYIADSFVLSRVEVSPSGDFKVYETKDVSKDIQFNADKTAFTYTFGTLNAGDQYYLQYKTTYTAGVEVVNKASFISDTVVKETSSSYKSSVSDGIANGKNNSKIKLVKVDANNQQKRLAGAGFKITHTATNKVFNVTTDANGEAFLDNMLPGEYKIEEVTVPKGYNLDPTPKVIQVASGEFKVETISNTQSLGKIELTKQDKATKALLKDAEFDVKDKDGKVVDHVVTNDKGVATTKELPLGEYTFVETKAPAGYELDATPISATIRMHNQVVTVAKDNVQSAGKIEVTKQDKDTKAVLKDAEFDVQDKDGKVVDHIVTNDKGVATTKELPLGDYKLVETKAPKGYKLDATPIAVKLGKHNETVQIKLDNVKSVGKIIVSKFDKASNARLSGMVFKIRNVETGLEKTIDMEKNNVMEIYNLPLGTYEITEVKAPNGYELDATVHTLVLEKDGDVKELNMYDVRKPETPQPPVTKEQKGKATLPATGATEDKQDNNQGTLLAITGVALLGVVSALIAIRKKAQVK